MRWEQDMTGPSGDWADEKAVRLAENLDGAELSEVSPGMTWIDYASPKIAVALREAVEAERAACEAIARHVAKCDGTGRGAAFVIAEMIAARGRK